MKQYDAIIIGFGKAGKTAVFWQFFIPTSTRVQANAPEHG